MIWKKEDGETAVPGNKINQSVFEWSASYAAFSPHLPPLHTLDKKIASFPCLMVYVDLSFKADIPIPDFV